MVSSASASRVELVDLPTEILQRIGFFLRPTIPYPINNKTNDSSYWTQRSTDLIQLGSCCRVLWHAVRSEVGVHFGVTVTGTEEGADLAAKLEVISGLDEVGGRPNLLAAEHQPTQSDNESRNSDSPLDRDDTDDRPTIPDPIPKRLIRKSRPRSHNRNCLLVLTYDSPRSWTPYSAFLHSPSFARPRHLPSISPNRLSLAVDAKPRILRLCLLIRS